MAYTDEDIAEMQNQCELWLGREDALVDGLFALQLQVPRAREMMTHGVCRRLSDLKHSLRRVFEILPPQGAEPGRDAIRDATAFLQTFVINTFGVMDNLAWLWLLEADVRDEKGRTLPRGWIGLTPDNKGLRGSLSARSQAYLAGTDDWFAYLEEYRHALAHRIPLYIPPKQLDEAAGTEFARLEAQVGAPGWDWARWPEVLAAQRRLGVFEPVMTHSFGEGARPVRFHGQMVNDFATVIEVGEHILNDLQGLRARADPAG